MELCEIDVKIEDKDLIMIWLASLLSSHENFVSFLSGGKDSITLEEVKSSLYSRELQLKVSRNGDEASVSRLLVTDFAKGQKKMKKGKCSKKSKVDPKDIYNYYKEPAYWKKNCPKKVKKYFFCCYCLE